MSNVSLQKWSSGISPVSTKKLGALAKCTSYLKFIRDCLMSQVDQLFRTAGHTIFRFSPAMRDRKSYIKNSFTSKDAILTAVDALDMYLSIPP